MSLYWSTRLTHSHGGSDNCFCTCRPSVLPSVRRVPTFQNKTNFKRKQCSLLARLWAWPSGSLMTPVLYIWLHNIVAKKRITPFWTIRPLTFIKMSLDDGVRMSTHNYGLNILLVQVCLVGHYEKICKF